MKEFYCYVVIDKTFNISFGRVKGNSKKDVANKIEDELQNRFKIGDKKHRIIVLTELEFAMKGKDIIC